MAILTRFFFTRIILSIVIFFLPVFFIQAQTGLNLFVKTSAKTIEIRNGLLGIVIPAETAFEPGKPCPAPVQSFIYSNGIYSNDKFNELTSPTPAVQMQVKLVSKTNEIVIVRIAYKFQKDEFQYGKLRFKGGESGPGFYTCTITVERGKKTISIEEDSNYDISYSIKISDGLFPDQARYRGWSAGSIQSGYEPSGKVYRPEHERGYPLDATVDIDYTKRFNYPRLVLWEPAGGENNSGRYWQLFNSKADISANLFGFFQGKPSRLIGARGVGAQLQIFPKNKEKEQAVLAINIDRRGADNSWYARKRFQWVAFISTKNDLLAPEKQQPIADAMNSVSGLGSVVERYASKPVKLIKDFYTCSIYMPAPAIEKICKNIKVDAELYKTLCLTDGGYKQIWDAWRYPDSSISLKRQLLQLLKDLRVQYTKGEGTYLFQYRYWQGSNRFKYYTLAASALFADKGIQISKNEKKDLEQLVGLMARIVWDDNNVPLFDSAGINLGPANMPFMYNNSGRIFFALLLANDPEFSGRAKLAVKMINNDIEKAIYANGSSIGTPHYIQPTIEPVLFSMLQLKQAGIADLFKSNKKVQAFARFYSMLLTPPSVRFLNNRKLISFGDGSEESAVAFVLLAAGLRSEQPMLSAELLSSFWYGPTRGTNFGSVGLTIDLSLLPERKFSSATSNYKGYVSHFRNGVNTINESALWVLNGDDLYDHRNDDAGEVSIYALKAPLSLSRSSFYYPSATDARIRSVVVPENMFPQWNKPDQPIAERSLTNRTWTKSGNTEFANLGNCSSTTIKMERNDGKQWFRKINWINLHEEFPIIVFYDSVTDKEANIWSMMMMSEGAVNTSAGAVIPEKKFYDNINLKQLPKSTPQKHLEAGLNRFAFTGQTWPAHATGGINWELYTCSSSAIDFTLADWSTSWQNTIEKREFQQTNKQPYSESQQIIRLRSNKPFFNILLPFKKGLNPYQDKVKFIASDAISLQLAEETIILNAEYYALSTKDGFCGALLSQTGNFSYAGFSISGGYTELEYKSGTVKIRVHGSTGERKIVLPLLLKMSVNIPGVKIENSPTVTTIIIDYKSTGIDLPNGEKGFKEFIFNVK